MTESTWYASCLKHRCAVALVAFNSGAPSYHRSRLLGPCDCPNETLVIHHVLHGPLEAFDIKAKPDPSTSPG